jgi:DNA-binding MarR family transcriptional regulator
MYNSYSNHYGISISYAYVLLALSTKKGKPSTQIAPELGMESRSITRLLKNMEEEGYIRKSKDSDDKRQVLIFLTEDGQKKRALARDIVKNFNNLLLHEIPEDQIEIFFKVLDKVNRLAEQNHLIKDENI